MNGAGPWARTFVGLGKLQIKQLQAGSPPSPSLSGSPDATLRFFFFLNTKEKKRFVLPPPPLRPFPPGQTSPRPAAPSPQRPGGDASRAIPGARSASPVGTRCRLPHPPPPFQPGPGTGAPPPPAALMLQECGRPGRASLGISAPARSPRPGRRRPVSRPWGAETQPPPTVPRRPPPLTRQQRAGQQQPVQDRAEHVRFHGWRAQGPARTVRTPRRYGAVWGPRDRRAMADPRGPARRLLLFLVLLLGPPRRCRRPGPALAQASALPLGGAQRSAHWGRAGPDGGSRPPRPAGLYKLGPRPPSPACPPPRFPDGQARPGTPSAVPRGPSPLRPALVRGVWRPPTRAGPERTPPLPQPWPRGSERARRWAGALLAGQAGAGARALQKGSRGLWLPQAAPHAQLHPACPSDFRFAPRGASTQRPLGTVGRLGAPAAAGPRGPGGSTRDARVPAVPRSALV